PGKKEKGAARWRGVVALSSRQAVFEAKGQPAGAFGRQARAAPARNRLGTRSARRGGLHGSADLALEPTNASPPVLAAVAGQVRPSEVGASLAASRAKSPTVPGGARSPQGAVGGRGAQGHGGRVDRQGHRQ